MAVFDGSNLVQNTLTAARSLNEVNNQVMQLEHEVTMLQNEARNLTTLPFNIVSQLQATLSSTTQLINQAQGIAFQLQQAQALFNQFYPASYGAGVPGASMAADALQRWTHSLRSLQTTVGLQAQAATNLNADANYLATLVVESGGGGHSPSHASDQSAARLAVAPDHPGTTAAANE